MSAALEIDARESVLGTIAERAAAVIAPLARKIDQDGLYPDEGLRDLGRAGLFAMHLPGQTPLDRADLGAAVAGMAAVGRHCMSTAFCTWCQDAAGWYLENSANSALRERLQDGIASGAILGGTGLSNPMKSFAQIETFKLRAQRVDGGWLVNGSLPWVSNIGDGHWFGTVFENADKPGHRIMAMLQCGQPGVSIRQSTHFIALEGTGTYAVICRAAFIADDQILADPCEDMVKRIKPGFILLQTGMGLGVIEAAIALMRASDQTLGHTNRFLPARPDDIGEQLEAARAEIMALAAEPYANDREHTRRILTVRLAIGELSLAAAQAAVLHAGARGYVAGSPENRRQRESTFVAILTPSIKHLRQELAALAA